MEVDNFYFLAKISWVIPIDIVFHSCYNNNIKQKENKTVGKFETCVNSENLDDMEISECVGIRTERYIYLFLDHEHYISYSPTDTRSYDVKHTYSLQEYTIQAFLSECTFGEKIVEIYKDYDIIFTEGIKND